MKFSSSFLSLLLIISFVFTLPAISSARDKYVHDEILIKIKPGKEADFEKAAEKQSLKTKKVIREIGYRVMKLPKNMSVDEALKKLKDQPSVDYTGPNHKIRVVQTIPQQNWPDDPVFFGDELLGIPQWGLYNDGYNGILGGKYRADIHAPEAWSITTGSANVIIANLDTGVDSTHEDLWDKVLPGYNATDGTTDTSDYHGHGTSTAAISAASSNNGVGMTGVSWGSPILPVKVIGDNGEGSEADAADGIIWAVNHGAKVLNMSFATTDAVPVLEEAVNYAWQHGSLPVGASGNEEVSFNMYPAAYENVLAVGASNQYDGRCTPTDWSTDDQGNPQGSNYGPYLDMVAPGNMIVSVIFDYEWGMSDYFPNSGTSAAAPFVSGAAALVWSIHPTWSNQQVFYQLTRTSDDVGSVGWDQYTGWGRLNAYRALTETVSNPLVASLGLLRDMPDGKYVELTGKIITSGTGQISNKAYIEELNRSGGIMIYCPSGVQFGLIPGDKVNVNGTLSKVNGERALVGATIKETSPGTALRPVGITNKACTGPAGKMLQGMLVKIWGRVSNLGWDYMYVDDGSGLDDGSGYPGIRIPVPNMSMPGEGSIVSVVGALGMDIPQGSTKAIPVVHPRNPGDIKTLKTGG